MRPRPKRPSSLLILALLAAACSPGSRDPSPASSPSRIVSLAPGITEILFALGLGDRVVGVTTYCDFPPEARAKPKVGGYADPSAEAILEREPDLVLVSPGPGNRDAALALERAGLRVVVVPMETLEETLAAMRAIGEACGVPERGSALERAVRERLETVSRRLEGRPPVPALFCVQIDPLIVAGAGTLPSELMRIAGGKNVIEAPRYPRIGIESVLELAPEVVLQSRMDAPSPEERGRESEFWNRWASLPAVRSRRVYVVDGSVVLRPGPRVADAAEELAGLLHPEDVPR